MNDKVKDTESIYPQPPQDIVNDPAYRDAIIKEWAKHSFDQQTAYINSVLTKATDFQNSSMEIIKEAATSAGKSVIILNGAAAIAVLTKLTVSNNLICAMLLYSWGAGTGALIFGCTYLAQHFFRHHRDCWGKFFQAITIFFFLLGFALFIAGTYYTAAGFKVATSVPSVSK